MVSSPVLQTELPVLTFPPNLETRVDNWNSLDFVPIKICLRAHLHVKLFLIHYSENELSKQGKNVTFSFSEKPAFPSP